MDDHAPVILHFVLMRQTRPFVVQVEPFIFLKMSQIYHQVRPVLPRLEGLSSVFSYCVEWIESLSSNCKFLSCLEQVHQKTFI
jgi:hypothetical protein